MELERILVFWYKHLRIGDALLDKSVIELKRPIKVGNLSSIAIQMIGLIICFVLNGCSNNIIDPDKVNPLLIPDAYLTPSFSPNGKEIIFIRHYISSYNIKDQTPIIDSDSSGLWIMQSDGSNYRMLLTPIQR